MQTRVAHTLKTSKKHAFGFAIIACILGGIALLSLWPAAVVIWVFAFSANIYIDNYTYLLFVAPVIAAICMLAALAFYLVSLDQAPDQPYQRLATIIMLLSHLGGGLLSAICLPLGYAIPASVADIVVVIIVGAILLTVITPFVVWITLRHRARKDVKIPEVSPRIVKICRILAALAICILLATFTTYLLARATEYPPFTRSQMICIDELPNGFHAKRPCL